MKVGLWGLGRSRCALRYGWESINSRRSKSFGIGLVERVITFLWAVQSGICVLVWLWRMWDWRCSRVIRDLRVSRLRAAIWRYWRRYVLIG